MRRSTSKLGLAAFAVVSIIGLNSRADILYNPVVSMIGDGAATLNGSGRTTTIRLYQNTTPAQASPISQLAFNSGATGTRLINSDSASAEALLSNNPALIDKAASGLSFSGNAYVITSGYDAANGTGDTTTSLETTANVNRVVGYMSVNGNTVSGANIPLSQSISNVYQTSTGQIRSAVGDDSVTNFWTGGNGGSGKTGFRYFNTNTQLDTTNTNTRDVEIHGGQLFGTSGANTHGLFAIGSGTPTAATSSTTLIDTGASPSSSPYEFVLIDDPNLNVNTANSFGYDTAYLADDRPLVSGGGIQKWTWNGTAWSLQYTLSDGVGGNRGLAGQLDLSTGNVVLWATTASTTSSGSALEQVTDTGAASTFITLATAPANDRFFGVALAPIPEPTFLAAVSLLLPMLVSRRRRV